MSFLSKLALFLALVLGICCVLAFHIHAEDIAGITIVTGTIGAGMAFVRRKWR